ncbi:UDP-N-acetylmuramoyl-tripeptide--D-alanyl-D-alanine ligase [Sphingomonas sp. BGYR3]|uniref:UDP-N-acetylmuramoyl-tripeptide--D-alanyl-D- alanine ligase n=1 Tax=Sphingomonas sp. BGYR3 TaxID=2975483 RepID=UPI0021A8AE1F|nr:UDP-N-acetylmuramoyl-tripeptide--D-alanyl-D-alanine ligase [Sphingomonas sp. BGYR3]MDG5489554.1 UDP-N-acetylmuramoyl-tripeptide--D-alanyl-D-alanine ligase [Sphingomonas sp. BGYR3]
MTLWTAAEIAAATGGTASADFTVTGVTFDSREVQTGDLFIAMKGEASDGHRYLDQAMARGAAGLIVSEPTDHPHVRVADGFAALNALGVAARTRMTGTVIGVTGSVGKTGTKEALFAALDRTAPGAVHRSVKSYNNHTGVPLSLSRAPAASRFGVFEMGMNHAGEIAALTRMVRPHVAVITAIAPAHIEFFKDESGIADAKGEIFQGLEPGGTAVVPFDSVHRDRLIGHARPHAGRIVTFGTGEGADVRALDVVRTLTGGSEVTAKVGDRQLTYRIGMPGAHWVSNSLAVLAAVDAAGGDLALAGLALADMADLPGRGARVGIAVGGGHALLIDESYNANAASMRATLAVLAAEPATRRAVVLGEMRELGDQSAALHAALADPVVAADVRFAVLVGEGMAPLAKALEGRVEMVHVPDATAATAAIGPWLAPGDVVLVKGSNGVRLATLVAALAGKN